MGNPKEEKDELEGVETISREQAEKEIREAARKVQNQKKPSSKAKVNDDDEMEDVEIIPREQAEREMREAVRRVQNQQKKS